MQAVLFFKYVTCRDEKFGIEIRSISRLRSGGDIDEVEMNYQHSDDDIDH